MFKSMRMNNFKSWSDTGDLRLAPLTGFFGNNSSGKSSLLQMLLLLKQTTESNDRSLVLKTGSLQEGYVNLGTVQEIIQFGQTQLGLSVSWDLPEAISIPGNNVDLRTITFENGIYASGQQIYVKHFAYRAQAFSAGMVTTDEGGKYQLQVRVNDREPLRTQSRPRIHFRKPQKSYGFSDEALLTYQNTEYLSDLVLAFEQQFSKLHYLGPLREYPQRIYTWAGEKPTDVGLKGELAVAALLAGKQARVYPRKKQTLTERVEEWLNIMGLAASFEPRPLTKNGIQYEVRLRRTADSPEVLIADVGFGVSQVLPVLVLCYYAPPGTTLIFEQPEIHLHPAVQSALADVFIDVIQKRNIQIIFESHSEHLLRRLQRRIAENELTLEETALYFCNAEHGKSSISELQVDDYGNIRNWPRDFFGDLTTELYEIAQLGLKRQLQNGR
jgi:predicted ATPase